MKRALLAIALLLALPAAARAGDVTMVARDVPLGPRSLQASAPPIRFDMLGLHWQGPGAVSYRTRSLVGSWSAWRLADADAGPDPSSAESHPGWHDGNLDWTAPANGVQFRTAGRVTRLRAYYLWSRASAAAAQPLRTLSVAGSPSIVPRSSWEADEKIVRARPRIAPSLQLAVVHHTAGTNRYTPAQSAAIVRGIEVYHVRANGWNDIGYNFLVDRYGTVYEGRGGGVTEDVIGAHALGFNTGTVGVALIGNFTAASPPPAMEAALVRLLAWRLDLGHVNPLATVDYRSSGNPEFKAGKIVRLRAISGHRDTGPTECPGAGVYRLLPSIARRVAATGLPKLYAPAVKGLVGGRVRFTARLSSSLPWTVTVTNSLGRIVARHTGVSADVDWTWDSTPVALAIPIAEPLRWTIDAGGAVLPASGSLGQKALPPAVVPLPRPAKPPAVVPLPRPAKPPAVVPLPRPIKPPAVVPLPRPIKPPAVTTPRKTPVPTPPPAPAPAPATPAAPANLLTGLAVAPAVLTPAAENAGTTITVAFALGVKAFVTVQVVGAAGSASPPLGLLAANVAAGPSSFQWDVSTLPNGRYTLIVTAQPPGTQSVSQSVALIVDRTLSSLTAGPSTFSPNADGVNDTITFGFTLAQPTQVQVVVQRAGVAVATVFAAQLGAGLQSVSWDGTSAGARLPDGPYVVVVTATDPLGTVSLLQSFTIDATPPGVSVVDAGGLRFSLDEPATVTAVVNGETVAAVEPAGVFALPWTGGPVTSFSVSARDAAGNTSAALNGP